MQPRCRTATTVSRGVAASLLLGLAACSFGDLFRTAGPRSVAIAYSGDSVLFVGGTSGFSIVVTAGGVPIANPDLTLESSDTTIFTITAARDSLLAVGNGSARLTARLNDPAFTDSMPTLEVRIRVHGGP